MSRLYLMSRDQRESRDKDAAFDAFAANLADVEEEDRQARERILSEGIAELEEKYGETIQSSRVLIKKLTTARSEADLSPFVGTSGRIKSPRFRRGEFLEILSRELLYIGHEEMKNYGGITSMDHLRNYFEEHRENWDLRDKDIPEAVEILDRTNLIAGTEELDGTVLVYFKAIELSEDPRKMLEVVHGLGEITRNKLQQILGWSTTRVEKTLGRLEKDGIVINAGTEIYFPGIQ